MVMRIVAVLVLLAVIPITSFYSAPARAGTPQPPPDELEAYIMDRLEKRYAGENFSAAFFQESRLAALNIADTAEGEAWFMHPGKMRWEYQSPDRHIIITDGETLWIHRPGENQVVKGDAATYFGDGKGAGFLANFRLVTEAFDVRLEGQTEDHWRLKLVPYETHYELSAIYLHVNKLTTHIEHVITENVHNDTTVISFENLRFEPEMDPSLFEFTIPEGTDVIHMDE